MRNAELLNLIYFLAFLFFIPIAKKQMNHVVRQVKAELLGGWFHSAFRILHLFHSFHFPKTNAVLFPPKAKEFERAMPTGLLRA